MLRGNSWDGRARRGPHRSAAAIGGTRSASGKRSDQYAGAGGRNSTGEDAGTRSAGDGTSHCDRAHSDADFTRETCRWPETAFARGGYAVLFGGREFDFCR